MAQNVKPSPDRVGLSSALVAFYQMWHGKLHLPGAGRLLHRAASLLPSLQNYPLGVPPGNTICVDFRDVTAFSWINHLLGEPFEEQGLITAISRRPKARGVCWDVGANGGLFASILARKVRPRQVEFFEPQPFLCRMARDATAGMAFVRGHDCALSDHSGVARFLLLQGESTKARILSKPYSGRTVDVRVEAGDRFMVGGRVAPPDLVKIDTEGHEGRVLTGLAETVFRYQPDIFFEHLSLTKDEIEAMRPDGYELFTVRDCNGDLVPELDRSLGHNSAFLPTGKR